MRSVTGVLTVFMLLSSFSIKAQQDTVSVHKIHSPKRALISSAALPGLGQVYNKKYWKVPIIYGGAAALIYSFSFNNGKYQAYLDAYRARTDGDPSTTDAYLQYSPENLILLKDYYRRNRDLSAIGMVLLYSLNMVDAYVDAQLFDFDVSDDLSLQIRPFIDFNHASLTLSVKL